ncbi:lipoprotein-anchoring transpeptidase ErfK/SrfK [Ancylobacter sp. 3268]|uniref:L,D-transpeptidase n=1 Tax=Ancylobacter sp. 3268 TaxID=2817752 RepID=UPI002858175C|nr:L,D-transpeptidase [Ancylobacter sp. 3268]MDR6954034.1 lipoprotein-anchoring transpeptidase ErfK/SrfK [Ancylobacter sp. 3268]
MRGLQTGGRRPARAGRRIAGAPVAVAIASGMVLAALIAALAGALLPSPAAAQSSRTYGGSFYGIDDGNYAVFSSRPREPAGGAGGGHFDENAPAPVYQSGGGRGVNTEYNRQYVPYVTTDSPGTVIIDTGARFLYLVQGGGRALRYGIGVGREGFAWSGAERISRKAEWPSWTPPPEMHARRPGLPERMEGGPENPLGARALYLGSTLYRIHGTNEADSIGQAVSSGCIRMRNDDVIDLYNRVRVGTLVRVI